MKTFKNKFVAITAVAGLAVLGAACEAEETNVESPGVTEPATDDTFIEEGDTTVEEGDTEVEADPDAGTDTTLEGDTEATEETTE